VRTGAGKQKTNKGQVNWVQPFKPDELEGFFYWNSVQVSAQPLAKTTTGLIE
jgi:hypothetical protein